MEEGRVTARQEILPGERHQRRAETKQVHPLPERRAGIAHPKAVDLTLGTKDVLAYVLGPGTWSRFHSALLVGTGRNHSNLYPKLAGGLAQRLALRTLS